MYRAVYALILFVGSFSKSFSFEDNEWLKEVQSRIDLSAVELAKELSKEKEELLKEGMVSLKEIQQESGISSVCGGCSRTPVFEVSDPNILIFISFSVPDNTWIQLSRELEGGRGVFVLRGLPNNSFNEFASKILDLKNKGMTASVTVDPKLFQEYDIDKAPTFVFRDKEGFDKVSGNISLRYALGLIDRKGENNV